MSAIYNEETINEWLFEHVDPIKEKLVDRLSAVRTLLKFRVFPRKSFKILRKPLFFSSKK